MADEPIKYPLGLDHKKVAAHLRALATKLDSGEITPGTITIATTNVKKEWETRTLTLTYTARGESYSGFAWL